MGTIHINRNRQSLGQFSEQEVADGLQSGQFRPDDLAWQEPMPSWEPLSTFGNLPPPSASLQTEIAEPLASEKANTVAPAWEEPIPQSFFPLATKSIQQVITAPTETFRAMPCEGGLSKPMKFYILVSWITGAVALIYQGAAAVINPAMFAGEGGKHLPSAAIPAIFAVVIVLLPVFLLLGSFISSGLLHVGLLLVGGAKKPFETTYRVFCYASGATSALQLIPLCGGWMYSIASLIYCVIGLKEAHRTDLWRPIVGMLLVFLVCCGAVFGMVALAVGIPAFAASAK